MMCQEKCVRLESWSHVRHTRCRLSVDNTFEQTSVTY